MIVVANEAAFEFRYGAGTATIAGTYIGSFRNSGEIVRLEAADTSVISEFEYGDESPWPTDSDGTGFSLIFAGGDPSDPISWRSSTAIGGDPGTSNSTSFSGGDLIAYALEPSGLSVEIVGSNFILRTHIDLSADDVKVSAQFSTDLNTWVTAPAADLISRTNHGDGTATWTFRAPLPQSTAQRQFGRIHVALRP